MTFEDVALSFVSNIFHHVFGHSWTYLLLHSLRKRATDEWMMKIMVSCRSLTWRGMLVCQSTALVHTEKSLNLLVCSEMFLRYACSHKNDYYGNPLTLTQLGGSYLWFEWDMSTTADGFFMKFGRKKNFCFWKCFLRKPLWWPPRILSSSITRSEM